MAFFSDKPADNDAIRFGAKQIRENFNGIINDGIVISKPPLYGEGSPAANVGRAGERYIDTKTGNQYLKNTSDKWEMKVSLDSIINDTIGSTVNSSISSTINNAINNANNEIINTGIVIPKPSLYGAGVPATNIGQPNELYIDTKTGNHYLKKSSGNWESKLSMDSPVEKVQVLGNCSGAITINATNGNIITMTVKSALTITLSANASNSYGRVLTLIMANAGSYTVTWPSSVKWAGNMAPTLTATGTDIVTLITTDNGTRWLGMLGGGGFA